MKGKQPHQYRITALGVVYFPVLYLLLAAGYQWNSDSAMVRFYIENFTVNTAALLINFVDILAQPVVAQEEHLLAPSLTLSIRDGCDGIETLMLLWAAVLVARVGLLKTVYGIILSFVFIVALNQLRIVVLFYMALFHKSYFSWIHGYIAPTVMILLSAIAYMIWLRWASSATSVRNVS